MRKIVAVIFATITMLIGISGCSDKNNTPDKQTIYYNTDSEPVSLDPQIAADNSARLVVMNIFEGLTRLGENNEPVPGAAEKWSVNSDKTVYTFTLRKDLKWSDGERLYASDFIYGIRRALLPDTGSALAGDLFMIKNAEAVNSGKKTPDELGLELVDENTLKITLEHPDANILYELSQPESMPCCESFFKECKGQYGREGNMIRSNGAFTVGEYGWSHNEYIRLGRNENYIGEKKPVPSGVYITIGAEYESITDSISDGTLDCYELPGEEVEKAEKNNLTLTSFGDTVWGIAFNTKHEIYKNTDIRRALLSALDRTRLLSQLPKGSRAAAGIIPDSALLDGKSYRSTAGSLDLDYYSDTARTDLARAVKGAKLTDLTINMICPDDDSVQPTVNSIMEQWNGVSGKFVNKIPVPREKLSEYIKNGDYGVVIVPLKTTGNTPLDTLSLFRSTSDKNPSSLCDSVFDDMLKSIEQGAQKPDTTAYAEKYLCDTAVFYPLFIENRYYASSPDITGILFHPFGAEADFIYAKKTPGDKD